MDITTLQRIDKSGMYQIYDNWPLISKQAYEEENEKISFENIEHIIFSGMGGSGHLSNLFYSILSKTNIHVEIVKGYQLPKTASRNTLVIPISISGNTIETVSVLNEAKEKGCKIVSFSSGGRIEEVCLKKKVEHVKVPFRHSPRASFTSTLYTMLNVLEPIIPTKKENIMESINSMRNLNISSENLTSSNQAIELAENIHEIPLLYYPWGLESAAIRFKNSLQENAKMHVIAEDIIEACHNGIVAWEKHSEVHPILLQGKDDHSKTKERWKIIKQYFTDNKIDFNEVQSVSGNILTKLVSYIYLFDYASIYKAVLSNIDPSPVSSINYIKRRN